MEIKRMSEQCFDMKLITGREKETKTHTQHTYTHTHTLTSTL